ncbi:gephyrin [Pseudomyrmex gracilis]|uniref:gephyrin n=1 Tax=Pseudomyrmex gracilis TaxID=219809 RepID=UPI0009957AB6|nr:gephyrin [Pseudomyrmex gracilis]XP_020281115.1 gephyrin [Pseudomyrmex gracilis]
MMPIAIRFGILTVSDTCTKDKTQDKSGPALKTYIEQKRHMFDGIVSCTAIVEDDQDVIAKHLTEWCDKDKADVIFTTGGTGLGVRDVTPEATRKILHKEVPGISTAILEASLKITPMAMLSRAVSGVRNRTLIINLPGSHKAAIECMHIIECIIPHAVSLILDDKTKIQAAHAVMQRESSVTKDLHAESHFSLDHCKRSIEKNMCVATRLRESPFSMISVEKAVKIIRDSAKTSESEFEIVNLNDALDRIIIEDIYSDYDLPPFRASIKDGYAVLHSDGKGLRKVIGASNAGSTSFLTYNLASGTCVRVNTGAPVPQDATAVVQVEDTKLIKKSPDNTEEIEIEIMSVPTLGQDIRPVGSDIMKGSLILNKFTHIGPVEMGLLAACGIAKVKVSKLPRVGVMSTGNELQTYEQSLEVGHIYDSNRITLISLLKKKGFEPVDLGIVEDDYGKLLETISNALNKVDVIVTTGSVSMGDKDMLKQILTDMEATILFGRVNMKPGKPTTFATVTWKDRKKYFMCLPGNPVSAIVTAQLFLLPLLNEMSFNHTKDIIVRAKLNAPYNLDPRPEYARAILNWDDHLVPVAQITGNQISSKLLSCRDANALLMFPGQTSEKKKLGKDDFVPAMLVNF